LRAHVASAQLVSQRRFFSFAKRHSADDGVTVKPAMATRIPAIKKRRLIAIPK
jgi:hypothetical protein